MITLSLLAIVALSLPAGAIVAARVLEEYPKATDIMVVALSERDLAELALQTIGVTPAELAAESEGSNT